MLSPRLQTFCPPEMCGHFLCRFFFFFLNKKTQEEQETREGQESTTKATAEITTEEVQRENSIAFPAFLLAARGLSLPPIGSKIALGFYKEQKASPPVDLS